MVKRVAIGLVMIVLLVILYNYQQKSAYEQTAKSMSDAQLMEAHENSRRGKGEYSKDQMEYVYKEIEYRAKKNKQSLRDLAAKDIAKKDGSIDARPDDINELAKDWVFRRNKIMEADKTGDQATADKHRKAFSEINRWLSEYKDEDVSAAISRAEKEIMGR